MAAVYELAELAGRPATLAAMTFAAYMVGSLTSVTVLNPTFFRLTVFPHGIPLPSIKWLRRAADRIRGSFGVAISTEWAREFVRRALPDYEEDVGSLASRVVLEIPDLAVDLRVKHRDLYDEYDRKVAEAEFRLSVAAPLYAGAILAAARVDPLLALPLVVVTSVLVVQGLSSRSDAQRYMMRMVELGLVSSPTLENSKGQVEG